LDKYDCSALATALLAEAKAFRDVPQRQELPLFKFLELVMLRHSAFKPKYARLGLLLQKYTDIYKQRLAQRFPNDSEAQYLKILSEDVSSLISNAKRGDSAGFVKALIHCVWENNHDLGVFGQPPIERGRLSLGEWKRSVIQQILNESNSQKTVKTTNYVSDKTSDITAVNQLLFLRYKHPHSQEQESIEGAIKNLRNSGVYVRDVLIDANNADSVNDDITKYLKKETPILMIVCLSLGMIKKIAPVPSARSLFKELLVEPSNVVLVLTENADIHLDRLGVGQFNGMYLHTEYGSTKLFDNISRASYKKRLGLSEFEKHSQLSRRKFTGIRKLETSFDPPLDEIQGDDLTVFIFDVDNMTSLNRFHSEDVGDLVVEVIRETLLKWAEISGGIADQFGDDSFFLTVPNGNADQFAFRFLEDIKNFGWQSISSGLWVTISVGTATRSKYSKELGMDVVMRAILGLREAKRKGGNCIEPGPLLLPHSSRGQRSVFFGSGS
jgi:GGDEF domain-containing protein